MMILSVSRRTDIPAFYLQWFLERQKEGFVFTRNPMNRKQVSKIYFEDVSCYVFWTKDPHELLINYHQILKPFLLHVTITSYGIDTEGVCDKKRVIHDVIELSKIIGKDQIFWRYDPILFTDKYTISYHLKAFEKMCKYFEGHLDRCVISFVEVYRKVKKALTHIESKTDVEQKAFVEQLKTIAESYGIALYSCGTTLQLPKANCINEDVLTHLNITGYKKDSNQRDACGCLASVDIGSYNTCLHECIYCYANHNNEQVKTFYKNFNMASEILGAPLVGDESIKIKSIKPNPQLTLNIES